MLPASERTTISGSVCRVVFSWSAGERVSGRYMARDSNSKDVGICWFRCSSSHYDRCHDKYVINEQQDHLKSPFISIMLSFEALKCLLKEGLKEIIHRAEREFHISGGLGLEIIWRFLSDHKEI